MEPTGPTWSAPTSASPTPTSSSPSTPPRPPAARCPASSSRTPSTTASSKPTSGITARSSSSPTPSAASSSRRCSSATPPRPPQVRFVVSYGTPHTGSTVARLASLYDKDPLLNDLSDAQSNSFLTQLEDHWRATPAVNQIHRFCAYETEDITADDGIARYLKAHTRVVGYISATYGCDVTTPPQQIPADHIRMIKPADRASAAYDFFRRVYRDNPVLEPQTVTRDNVIAGLTAGCNEINQNPDLQVPIALESAFHERVTAASATLIDTTDVRDVTPNPPIVTRVDQDGVAHVNYGFKGPGKKLLVCLGTARAALKSSSHSPPGSPARTPELRHQACIRAHTRANIEAKIYHLRKRANKPHQQRFVPRCARQIAFGETLGYSRHRPVTLLEEHNYSRAP